MAIEVDPKFRGSGRRARRRRMRRRVLRWGSGLAAALVLAGAGFFVAGWFFGGGDGGGEAPGQVQQAGGDDFAGFDMVQTEGTAEATPGIGYQASFIDLRRDPMILRLKQSDGSQIETLAGPADFAPARAGAPAPDRLSLLHDALFSAEKELITTLPSSREDFALFQAQRSQAIATMQAEPVQTIEAHAGTLVRVEEAGSFGAFISGASEDGTPPPDDGGDGAAVYVETEIQNTTSVALALRESQRLPLYDDQIVVLQADRDLAELFASNGFAEDAARLIAEAAQRELGLDAALPKGSVVAMRIRPDVTGPVLMQASFYGPDGYLASLAQVGAGRFSAAADPWIAEDLLARSGTIRQQALAAQDVRLLDALYSAAIRNGLPTDLVGEMIVIMSKRFDLDRFVSEGDEVTMLYANHPGPEGLGLGRLMFLGIDGPSGKMPCYVAAQDSEGSFTCFDFNAPGSGGGGGFRGLGGGLVVPVQGVVTSGFGPRFHPILKQVRNHDGIDWGAPSGTPIVAAAAGIINYAGDGGGYGNVVYIDHAGGMQTRYAHMSRFGEGIAKGVAVKAGEVIGYVGTTGRSTGPHLHFEVRVNGAPVDPQNLGGGGGAAVASAGGGGAVEALVNRIVHVESGGNAAAANPLSSAVGLGQFIQSTWIRMMRDYRPDLANTMSRAELLALRTDPALSREMVANLARENEAFLRARGHQITAGRLYLAHFLGPAGADTALSAAPGAMVVDVMGASVVNANPFLRDKTIADLLAWADRKMSGARGGGSVQVAAVPPEVKAFREAIDTILDSG